jgi:hypothetical protein
MAEIGKQNKRKQKKDNERDDTVNNQKRRIERWRAAVCRCGRGGLDVVPLI